MRKVSGTLFAVLLDACLRGRAPPMCERATLMPHGLHCPDGAGTAMVTHGLSLAGTHRSQCRVCLEGRGGTVLLEESDAGQSPDVTLQRVERAMNARGMRDTARVVHVSPTTVSKCYMKQKAPALHAVHHGVWQCLHPAHGEGERWRADAWAGRRGRRAALDAMGRSVHSTAPRRWVWLALAHHLIRLSQNRRLSMFNGAKRLCCFQ